MGFFSNLFGKGGKDIDNALGKMKDLAEDISNYADEDERRIRNNKPAPAGSEPLADNRFSGSDKVIDGPSGDSWGPVMPSETNQFNSGLGYEEYFTSLFNEAFAASYQIDKERLRDGKHLIFTFSQGGTKKLIVEILSDKTHPFKLRKQCRDQHMPYLRYYYDHEGWWNTKSYVTRRTAKALGI
ncbi:MAG: hypothetical protein IJK83_11525 [Clostridiales bacterium]|nr:hypothetical protein [Clostridiales bacterium]